MTKQNKIIIPEADAAKFPLQFSDVENLTGWSRAKIYRKIGNQLHPVYLQNKLSEPRFNENEVKIAAGFIEAVADSDVIEFADYFTNENETAQIAQTALVKPKQAKISKSQKNLTSEKNLKKSQSDFENVFLLPHKIYVTLAEAKLLTGFPMSALHKFSELKFGRRVIKKSKLEKI